MSDIVTICIENAPNLPARQWAARLLASISGFPFRIAILAPGEAPPGGPLVYYGHGECARGVTVRPSGYFDGDPASPDTPPGKPPARIEGLPVPFGNGDVARRESATTIGADLPASAFFLANRVEEASSERTDEHGRFPAERSFMAANDVLEKPLVDIYARFLSAELTRLYPGLERRRPWSGGTMAVCITHDIETLARIRRAGYLKAKLIGAGRALFSRRPGRACRSLYTGVSRAVAGLSPYRSLEHLRSGERPSPGTYYFFGGQTSPRDGAYDVGSQEIRQVLGALAEEGCETGVHLGYETMCDPDSMVRQKSRVEAACGHSIRGARHHYLRAPFPAVWKAHAKARFEYDTSLSFAESAGFRGGTSLPYRPFDADAQGPLDIFEVPLTAMDGTFFQYRGLSADKTVEDLMSLAGAVADVGGVFVLLWHNTMVDPLDRPDEHRAYFEITSRLREMGGWWTTVGECVKTWKEYSASLESPGR
ncbi:MAG: polysaccharide deacetylase family protein [Planctomycetes bacterium]|nr:polysaccharide deacetylase family protein [Planctomycetota bacterium]